MSVIFWKLLKLVRLNVFLICQKGFETVINKQCIYEHIELQDKVNKKLNAEHHSSKKEPLQRSRKIQASTTSKPWTSAIPWPVQRAKSNPELSLQINQGGWSDLVQWFVVNPWKMKIK